jgi:hypothetical protein
MSRFPRQPTGVATWVTEINLPDNSSVSFDMAAFDEAVDAHGVEFIHERAMVDPVGLADIDDIRRPGPGGTNSYSGMVYTPAGCFRALFTGNSKELRAAEQGIIDAATASITPARFYEGTTTTVRIHPRDRLFLAETGVLVTHQQLVRTHETGRDRLRFPAVEIIDLLDSAGVRFAANVDFKICDTGIEWLPNRRPAAIYAVRYTYRPHWIVDRLLHDVRVAQGVAGGKRVTLQAPQAAVVQREYVYLSQTPTEEPTERDAAAPPDGPFGPR